MAKALVGHVQESRQALGLDHCNHLVPLGGGDVVTGGVVAAGVQHDDGAGGGRVQVGQHAFEIDAALGRVVVGVGADFKTGVHEDGAVVFPAGVGNQHFGVGRDLFQEVSADFQAACAADGLHGGHAAGLDHIGVGAKDQAFDRIVIGHDAVDRQIATGRRLIHHGFFSGLYALQQRQLTVIVEVHAHAQVDLVGVGVGSKLLVQTQDRVAGGHFDGGKQRHEKVLESRVGGWQSRSSWVTLARWSQF